MSGSQYVHCLLVVQIQYATTFDSSGISLERSKTTGTLLSLSLVHPDPTP